MLMVRLMLLVGDALQYVSTDDALQLAYAVDVLQSVLILGMGRYRWKRWTKSSGRVRYMLIVMLMLSMLVLICS